MYGPDEISPVFIKEGCYVFVKPITELLNTSLLSKSFPDLWKQANVLPLHKKGPKNKLNNYRPVSLLSILGIFFKKIIYKYAYNYFRDNFLISIWQSGFLPGSSTVINFANQYLIIKI